MLELLADPTRCQVVLVTLPEETPVNELVETAYALEDEVGRAASAPVVVNGLYPDRPRLDRRPVRPPRRPATVGGRRGRAAAAAAFRPSPHRPAGASRSPASPSGSRSPRSTCRSCSPPASARRRRRRAGRRPARPASEPSPHDGEPAQPASTCGCARCARRASIIVCCGSGGVGKTTTAAVLAAGGGPPGPPGRASSPSTRPGAWPTRSGLAGGLDQRAHARIAGAVAGRAVGGDARHQVDVRRPRAPRYVGRRRRRPSGSWPTASTATSPARCPARRSTWRPRSSTSCTTTSDFDLVVVDTPPTRNALDFLDAPDRLTRFLDHRLYRILMTPTRVVPAGRQRGRPGVPPHADAGGRRRGAADAIAFFQAFDGMEAGLPRAGQARWSQLLTAPRHRLRARRLAPDATPSSEARSSPTKLAENDVRDRRADRQPGPPGVRRRLGGRARPTKRAASAGTPLGELWANLAEFRQVAEREAAALAGLADAGRRRRRSSRCRSCAPTSTTSTASPSIGIHLFARPWRPDAVVDRRSVTARDGVGGVVAAPANVGGRAALPDRHRRRLGRRRGPAARSRAPDTTFTVCRVGQARDAGGPRPARPTSPMLDLQIGTMGGMAVTHGPPPRGVRRPPPPRAGARCCSTDGRRVPGPPRPAPRAGSSSRSTRSRLPPGGDAPCSAAAPSTRACPRKPQPPDRGRRRRAPTTPPDEVADGEDGPERLAFATLYRGVAQLG